MTSANASIRVAIASRCGAWTPSSFEHNTSARAMVATVVSADARLQPRSVVCGDAPRTFAHFARRAACVSEGMSTLRLAVAVCLVTAACSATHSSSVEPDAAVVDVDAAPDAALPVCPCYFGAGLYCGTGVQTNGAAMGCTVPALDPGNLYRCAGTKTDPGTWTVAQTCTMGCTVAPPGVDDSCTSSNNYYLPWTAGVTYRCTQGHNQGSHTGTGAFAWDFGLP